MFIHEDFLLQSDTAKTLYHQYAEAMPLIDYHCHIDVKEVAADLAYDNVTQAWIDFDHYKWTVMRSCGIEEDRITGKGSDKEKFLAFAEALPRCIGNPMYHRSHMELKKYFGFDKLLCPETAGEAWEVCNRTIRENKLSVRKMITMSNVKLICTTDDPLDDLKAHEQLTADDSFPVQVLPGFRTDPLVNIEHRDFAAYIGRLGKATGTQVDSLDTLLAALRQRMDFFAAHGCRMNDQAVLPLPFEPWMPAQVDGILKRALAGEAVSAREMEVYRSALIFELAREIHRRGWVMQLHSGALRDINTRLLENVGVDVGGDCISGYSSILNLPHFFNALEQAGGLPKTIVYSIQPADNEMLDSMVGCFQTEEAKGKIQHGAAWWFNDNKKEIEHHLRSLASLGILPNFIGSLTDCRAYFGYSRQEYFRRILCSVMAEWIDAGEYPRDLELVGGFVQDICYNNVNRYFSFGL